MNRTLRKIYEAGIVPVIAIDDAEKAVPLAQALLRGGLNVAEITFRTDAAEAAMRAIIKNVPEMLVGAGTVLTREQLDRALNAGASFIVSPGFNPEIVKYAVSRNALILPGTATGGEMEQAMSFGLEAVKFFPAEQNGGVSKLKALAGPYRNLKWIPTGGISEKNLNDYLSFDRILACGGTWMVKKSLIEGERWDEIERLSRSAVRTMLDFSLMHVGINCADEMEAVQTASRLCTLFNLDFRPGNSSVFAGDAVECMKKPYLGRNGHIAVGTTSVDRAVAHLTRMGVEFDEDTCKRDASGSIKTIYLKRDFSGFAIHLVRK